MPKPARSKQPGRRPFMRSSRKACARFSVRAPHDKDRQQKPRREQDGHGCF